MRRHGLAALVLLAACGRVLELPTPPAQRPPHVVAVVPAGGFSGDSVALDVADLPPGTVPEVRFGRSAPVPVVADGAHFRVTVPDDATAGGVTLGASDDPAPFDLLGLGRLRDGRERLRRSFAPSVARAVRMPETGVVVMKIDNPEQFRVVGPDREVSFEATATYRPVIAELTADESALVLLSWYDQPRACPAGPGLAVERYLTDGFTDVDTQAADFVCLGFATPEDYGAFAVDPSGRWVLVLLERELVDTVVLVDLVDHTHVERDLPAGHRAWAAASAGPGRFVLADERGLRLVVAGAAEWPFVDDLGLPGSDRRAVSIAARPDGLAALGYGDGTLTLCDASGALPACHRLRESLTGVDTTSSAANVNWLRFSADGTRLAAAQYFRNRVLTFEIQGERGHETLEALGRALITNPRNITASSDGVFDVARAGGYATIAASTGALVGEAIVDLGVGEACLRPCADGLVVDVSKSRSDGLLELDPDTLAPVPATCAAPEGLRPEGHDTARGLACRPGVATAYAAMDHAGVLSFAGATLGEGPELAGTPGPEGNRGLLTLAEDGRTLLQLDGAHGLLNVFDATKPLPDEAPASLALPPETLFVGADGDRIVVLFSNEIRLFDRDRVLAGKRDPAVTLPVTDATSTAAIVRGGLYFTAIVDDALVRLHRLDLAKGTDQPGSLLARGNRLLQVSPSGRELVLVVNGAHLEDVLRRLTLVPGTADVAQELAPLAVPLGPEELVKQLLYAPTGERLYVLEGTHDQLIVVD